MIPTQDPSVEQPKKKGDPVKIILLILCVGCTAHWIIDGIKRWHELVSVKDYAGNIEEPGSTLLRALVMCMLICLYVAAWGMLASEYKEFILKDQYDDFLKDKP